MAATGSSRPDLIQVTYQILSDRLLDPEKTAKAIALGQTTETWTPREPSGLKKLAKHRGVALGFDECAHILGRPYEYHVKIGFPSANTENDIPTLLSMIFGKIGREGKIRVESIEFPDSYLRDKGPRFGIPGIREKVGETDKPLAMAILKPSVGPTPAELGKMFYELACGGMHFVTDDEILPDLSICPTEERLEACLEAGARAKQETGQMTLYAVHLTGTPTKIIAKARELAKRGASCFLVNPLIYGYGVLEELRDVRVPIMAHLAHSGALCASGETGLSGAVALGSLMRLGGADIVLFPSGSEGASFRPQETRSIKESLTWSMGPLRKSFPAPSARIYPGLVPKILHEYGQDVIIDAGSGVHEHPKGARAGARAFRQAIQWTVKRGNLGGVSQREFPELAEALRLWGKP